MDSLSGLTRSVEREIGVAGRGLSQHGNDKLISDFDWLRTNFGWKLLSSNSLGRFDGSHGVSEIAQDLLFALQHFGEFLKDLQQLVRICCVQCSTAQLSPAFPFFYSHSTSDFFAAVSVAAAEQRSSNCASPQCEEALRMPNSEMHCYLQKPLTEGKYGGGQCK
jgi:hypothetical protein